MQTRDLDFSFPDELIATEPSRACRVALTNFRSHAQAHTQAQAQAQAQAQTQTQTQTKMNSAPKETNLVGLMNLFEPGDLLVINDSQVIPARVFARDETEILFLKPLAASPPPSAPHAPGSPAAPATTPTPIPPAVSSPASTRWEVLFPAREFAVGDTLQLPHGIELKLTQKGLPQIVELSQPITTEYFVQVGEVALPPYIQQARGQRHNRAEDRNWYQTAWATDPGSVAAPTASLHFQNDDLNFLRGRGVRIARVTLHVGAGTFLPVRSDNLAEHNMHSEWATIPPETMRLLSTTRKGQKRIWALGTTVARTLESQAAGMLREQPSGHFCGETKLLIYPPYQFHWVDALLTNFHQPKSTLFALVAAFAGLENAKNTYAWAIERRFRLFSYGDLSAWF